MSYTSISLDSDPSAWGIPLMDADKVPEMDPYEEVSQQGQPSHPLSPAYIPDPIPMEDQLLPDDASHVALSPGYIADSDLKEDPIDYPADGGDDYDESSDDDDDDDDDDDYDVKEDEEEEHLAPADSTVVASPTIDHVPFAEETEPFESDKSAATPPPPPAYHTTARMSIQSQAPILCPSEAEVVMLISLPTPPPSPITPLSSPLS
ncbi:hypothetical protein Tco_0055461 [Tanacetum coccineum]